MTTAINTQDQYAKAGFAPMSVTAKLVQAQLMNNSGVAIDSKSEKRARLFRAMAYMKA